MSEVIGATYMIGVVVVFILSALFNTKMEGRVDTGEADFGSALMLSILWPFILFFAALSIGLLLIFSGPKDTPND